jgi:BMFP domain-containing protein YqiC
MANDIFSTLRTYLTKVTDGDKSATEVASAVNQWVREGGEALKIKIEDEVERSVSKMGFVKRGEFEALKEEVVRLKAETKKESSKKTATKKPVTKKPATKKAAAKKSTVKKASK